MAFLLADTAYLLGVVLDLAAFLLFLEWLVHSLPGASLNPIRRFLFQVSAPWLKWNSAFLAVQWGSFKFRGLLLAVLLVVVEHYAVSWLVILSYAMRG